MQDTFRALVLREVDGKPTASIESVPVTALPADDVLVRIAYSGLNYKDGLAITGRNKVVRSYPMIPGIDFAGTVEESTSPLFAPGDRVVLTGWGVGEWHWGGLAEMARAKSDWLVRIPDSLSTFDAMAAGTAGFTAMLCIEALEEHGLTPESGEVLVTGAAGGVGSLAVALLGRLGYRVVASTGRAEEHDYLKTLGATEIIDRTVLTAPSGPLASARWAGAVDTVGGDTLAGVLRTMAPNTTVAACGNAAGFALNTSVLPFILRGVNLLGINSLPVPVARRNVAWSRLAALWPRDALESTIRTEPLTAVPALANEIIAGHTRGHIVVDVNQ